MTGTAMVAGAAAASPRFGRRGDELGTALEAESRDFLAYFAAVALGTLDFWFIVEDDLLEVLVAFGAMIFKYGHSRAPFFSLIITKGWGEGNSNAE
jgi:hypothetical protein